MTNSMSPATRRVERDEIGVSDSLSVIVRDRSGAIVEARTVDQDSSLVASNLRAITAFAGGAVGLTEQTRQALQRVLADPDLGFRAYLVGMARHKINRSAYVTNIIDRLQQVLYDPERIEGANTNQLLRMLVLARPTRSKTPTHLSKTW